MRLFKHVFLSMVLIMVLGALSVSIASADSTIYLLRHAEKQKDGTKNPHLTEQGQQRAEYLAQHLSLANITKIYSTDTHRTQATVKPLSDLLGISVDSYNPRKLEELAAILKSETGQIVVVGHSNTTPVLATLLSGRAVASIDDDEYDNLYQIVLINKNAQLTRFKIFPID